MIIYCNMEKKLVLKEIHQDPGEKELLNIKIGNEILGWFGVIKELKAIGRKSEKMLYWIYLDLKEQVSDAIRKEYNCDVTLNNDHYPIDYTLDEGGNNQNSDYIKALFSFGVSDYPIDNLKKNLASPSPVFPFIIKFIDGEVELFTSTTAFYADFHWDINEKYSDDQHLRPDSEGYHTVNIRLTVKNVKLYKLSVE